MQQYLRPVPIVAIGPHAHYVFRGGLHIPCVTGLGSYLFPRMWASILIGTLPSQFLEVSLHV